MGAQRKIPVPTLEGAQGHGDGRLPSSLFPNRAHQKPTPLNRVTLMGEAPILASTAEANSVVSDMVISLGLQFFKEAPTFLRSGYEAYLHKAFTNELEVTC